MFWATVRVPTLSRQCWPQALQATGGGQGPNSVQHSAQGSIPDASSSVIYAPRHTKGIALVLCTSHPDIVFDTSLFRRHAGRHEPAGKDPRSSSALGDQEGAREFRPSCSSPRHVKDDAMKADQANAPGQSRWGKRDKAWNSTMSVVHSSRPPVDRPAASQLLK